MSDILEINEIKAKLAGLKVYKNSWGIAIKFQNGQYKIVTNAGEVPGVFYDVEVDDYFITASTIQNPRMTPINKRDYKIFIKDSIKPVMNRNRFISTFIPYNLGLSISNTIGKFRSGDVILATGNTRCYLISKEGNHLKLFKTISYITLDKVDKGIIVNLYGSLFTSTPLGWVSHDLKEISNKNLIG